MPIYEPGLEALVTKNVRAGRLNFTSRLDAVAHEAGLIFLAVGTPMRRGDGYADLSYVYGAIEEIAPHLQGFTVITTKSTVPVGTSGEIERRLRKLRPDADFAVCSNPEFLREGSAIQDFTHPDRVLVGVDDDRRPRSHGACLRAAPASQRAGDVREPRKRRVREVRGECLPRNEDQFHQRDGGPLRRSRRQCPAGRACHRLDGRIGDKFLHPGPGYGGSCFPKDVSALARTAREARAPETLVEQVEKVNTERKIAMAHKVIRAAGGDVSARRSRFLA